MDNKFDYNFDYNFWTLNPSVLNKEKKPFVSLQISLRSAS